VSRKDTAELLELLRQRVLGPEGQGSRAVFLDEVRGGTGFTSNRTIDAISVGMWPSHGCEIQGYELKTSRGDWRGELKQPEKAEEIARHCNRFWLVTTPGVAEADEVPPAWGWLERDGKRKRLICKREAKELETEGPPPVFVAAMLRRAVKADVNREIKARAKAAEADARAEWEHKANAAKTRADQLTEELAAYRKAWESFKEKTGMGFGYWTEVEERMELVGEVVLALRRSGTSGRVGSIKSRIGKHLSDLRRASELLDSAYELLSDDEGADPDQVF
jgi:hypothetical protein